MPENNDKPVVSKDGATAETDNTQLTLQNRHDWNDYLQWLKDNNIHGHPDLNKGEGADNQGNKVLQAYIQAVKDGKVKGADGKPKTETSLSVALVPHIQKDFANVKKYYQDEIKAGRMKYDTANGGNEKNFMSNISDVDGLAGTKTTAIPFPPGYLHNIDAKGNDTVSSTGLKTENVNSLTSQVK